LRPEDRVLGEYFKAIGNGISDRCAENIIVAIACRITGKCSRPVAVLQGEGADIPTESSERTTVSEFNIVALGVFQVVVGHVILCRRDYILENNRAIRLRPTCVQAT